MHNASISHKPIHKLVTMKSCCNITECPSVVAIVLHAFVETRSSAAFFQRFTLSVWPAAEVCVFNSPQMESCPGHRCYCCGSSKALLWKIHPHFFCTVFISLLLFFFPLVCFSLAMLLSLNIFPIPAFIASSLYSELRSSKSPLIPFVLTVH